MVALAMVQYSNMRSNECHTGNTLSQIWPGSMLRNSGMQPVWNTKLR